jgi:hypothetical protein
MCHLGADRPEARSPAAVRSHAEAPVQRPAERTLAGVSRAHRGLKATDTRDCATARARTRLWLRTRFPACQSTPFLRFPPCGFCHSMPDHRRSPKSGCRDLVTLLPPLASPVIGRRRSHTPQAHPHLKYPRTYTLQTSTGDAARARRSSAIDGPCRLARLDSPDDGRAALAHFARSAARPPSSRTSSTRERSSSPSHSARSSSPAARSRNGCGGL